MHGADGGPTLETARELPSEQEDGKFALCICLSWLVVSPLKLQVVHHNLAEPICVCHHADDTATASRRLQLVQQQVSQQKVTCANDNNNTI